MNGLNVDIERMAKETDINIVRIKDVLGIPLFSKTCNAKTALEAKEIFCKTADSETKWAAFERWEELSLKKVMEAKAIEEVVEAHNIAPSFDHFDAKACKIALDKWESMSLDEIKKAETPEEI